MNKKRKKIELEREGAKLPRRLVRRNLVDQIAPWLNREEVIVVTGARQTGKSVILFQLMFDHLLPRTTNIHYFNLDIPRHLEFFKDADRLVDLVRGNRGKSYVFIDEVQRLKEPGLFLKGLYDLHLPLKLVVSGSSALEIKSMVHEALTGRKALFHVNPFDLTELASAMFPGQKAPFKKVMEHYLTFGSYPAVALAGSKKMKLLLLKEIFQSYLEKDVKSLLKIENETAFINLIKLLSSQTGNIINKDELSNSLGIHKNTLDNYLFYLEQTFILDFVRPFYKNPRKELLKNPKIYFRDLGIRNFALQTFGDFRFRPDRGNIFENFVYLRLREKVEEGTPIHFWRTKAGAEVDFVLVKGLKPVPFEVKAGEMREFKIGKSFRSFLMTYRPEKAYLINLSLNGNYRIAGTKINFMDPAGLQKIKRI